MTQLCTIILELELAKYFFSAPLILVTSSLLLIVQVIKKYKNEINVGMTNKCKECEQYIRDVNASFIHNSTGIECNNISLILFR